MSEYKRHTLELNWVDHTLRLSNAKDSLEISHTDIGGSRAKNNYITIPNFEMDLVLDFLIKVYGKKNLACRLIGHHAYTDGENCVVCGKVRGG